MRPWPGPRSWRNTVMSSSPSSSLSRKARTFTELSMVMLFPVLHGLVAAVAQRRVAPDGVHPAVLAVLEAVVVLDEREQAQLVAAAVLQALAVVRVHLLDQGVRLAAVLVLEPVVRVGGFPVPVVHDAVEAAAARLPLVDFLEQRRELLDDLFAVLEHGSLSTV